MHYRDGQEAKLGDLIRGKPYNTPHEVVGTVVGLVAGADSCNLRVAFLKAERFPTGGHQAMPIDVAVDAQQPGRMLYFGHGGELEPPWLLKSVVDYGETKAFDLITRSV